MPLLTLVGFLAASAPTGGGEGKVVSADGEAIHYSYRGKGDLAVVLVHGWALDRYLWDRDVTRLAKRHRVVALDMAGHGESGRRRKQWTIASLGEDVKAVVDAEIATAEVKEVVLAGHSMGGPVVLEAARRMAERVKGIVLIDTLLDVEQRTPPEEAEAMARQLEADYLAVATRMASNYLFAEGTPAPVREWVLKGVTSMHPEISVALLRAAWTYDPLPALKEIKAPIRAVNADKFPTNLEVNRKHMPGYEAIMVRGSGHYPMIEKPKEFAAAFDWALAQVGAR